MKTVAKTVAEEVRGKCTRVQTRRDGEPHTSAEPEGEQAVAGLATTPLSAIRPEPVRYLVEGLIPLGKLTLFAGDGGHGKTTTTLELAAGVSRGRSVLGIPEATPVAGEVLIISCEDDYADTIVPRLLVLGADLSRIHRVDGLKTRDGKPAPFSLAHYKELEAELEKRPGVRLVIIDPAGAFIGKAGCNDHKDSELRALLGPLAELAAKHRVAIILIKHFSKGATTKAVHKVGGSAGYVNTVRAAFIVVPDSEDPERKLFIPLKFNIGPKPRGVAFRLQAIDHTEAEEILAPFGHLTGEDRERLIRQLFRPVWDGRTDDDADDVVGEAARKDPNKVQRCAQWMQEFVGVYAWPSDEIVAAAKRVGFTFDNVKEARIRLKAEKGLRSSKRGYQGAWWTGFGEPDTWTLRPEEGNPDTTSPQLQPFPQKPAFPQNGPPFPQSGETGESGDTGERKERREQGVRGVLWPESPVGGGGWDP